MSGPFTPEQEARLREIVRETAHEIVMAAAPEIVAEVSRRQTRPRL